MMVIEQSEFLMTRRSDNLSNISSPYPFRLSVAGNKNNNLVI